MKKLILFIALIPTLIFSQIVTDFQGIDFSDEKPPDPVIAVGENYVVLAVNYKLAVYEKDGAFVSEQSFADFFSEVSPQPAGGIFDPKLVYDHYSERFILLALNRANGNRFLLAVTSSNNPTGNWYKFSIENDNSNSLDDIDYPGLGYNESAIILTSHTLRGTNSFLPEIVVLKKDEVYSNNIIYKKYFYDFAPYPSKLKPARVLGISNLNKFLLIDTKTSSEIRIWAIINPLGGSNASLGLEKTITLSSDYQPPQDAVQKGESTKIDISNVGSSVSDVVCKDGILYCAYTIANASENGTSIKYFAIDIDDNYSLKTNGLIESNNIYYYYPVIHPDGSDNMVLVFNISSSSDYVGIAYTKGYKNSNSHGPIEWLKQGAAGYKLLLNGKNRWGDYSGIAMDPNNSTRVWIYGEWAKSTNQWSTWVGEIKTSEIKDFYFTNYYGYPNAFGSSNLGGTLTVDNNPINSGSSTPLETGTTYNATTNNERFPNWNQQGTTYKHNNWNGGTEDHYLNYGFEAESDVLYHLAVFDKFLYSKVALSLENSAQPDGGSISFNDPWYVKSDGSQHHPSSSTDLYWLNSINGYYEPNGKYGAVEKGVFLGQGYNYETQVWSPPYYQVKVSSPQPIYVQGKTRNFYFQNWEASPSGSATFQDANLDSTAVVFNNSGATVKAVLKGIGLSNNAAAFSNNSQRKTIRTPDNILHMVYESMGKSWYERSTDDGVTWELIGALNNGRSAKNPSIDFMWDVPSQAGDGYKKVSIVYDGDTGSGTYGVFLETFFLFNDEYLTYGASFLSDPNNQFTESHNSNPVIALGVEQKFMAIWLNEQSELMCGYGIIAPYSGFGGWHTGYPKEIFTDVGTPVGEEFSLVSTKDYDFNDVSMFYFGVEVKSTSTLQSIIAISKLKSPDFNQFYSDVAFLDNKYINTNPSISLINTGTIKIPLVACLGKNLTSDFIGYAKVIDWGGSTISSPTMGTNVTSIQTATPFSGNEAVVAWTESNDTLIKYVSYQNLLFSSPGQLSESGTGFSLSSGGESNNQLRAYALNTATLPYSINQAVLPTRLPDIISSNYTVSSGNYDCNSNMTVNSGVTLTIESGANITFENGASLIVNGLLDVNGTSSNKVTFDFIAQNSTLKNGIKINTGGSANIDYAIIKNAYNGVYVNEAVVNINNCEIFDCYYGVHLYRTNYVSYPSSYI
ncbi:MAG: hypothetical protein KKD86_11400, partial [Bacteroidetes bacterium]|nr:hypothetical protein [Bacteroidota bacterium]